MSSFIFPHSSVMFERERERERERCLCAGVCSRAHVCVCMCVHIREDTRAMKSECKIKQIVACEPVPFRCVSPFPFPSPPAPPPALFQPLTPAHTQV